MYNHPYLLLNVVKARTKRLSWTTHFRTVDYSIFISYTVVVYFMHLLRLFRFSSTPIINYLHRAVECCCSKFAYSVRHFHPSACALSMIVYRNNSYTFGCILLCRSRRWPSPFFRRRKLSAGILYYCSADPALGQIRSAFIVVYRFLPHPTPRVARGRTAAPELRRGVVDAY